MSVLSLMAQCWLCVCISLLTSCEMAPPLELVDREKDVTAELSSVIADIDVLWDYELGYEWEAEWHYGWDAEDMDLFGQWELRKPTIFNVRRYFTGEDPHAPHTSVLSNLVEGTRFQTSYKLGWYDVLVWNDVETLDGVQSLHYDETTSLEYVTAFTNQSMNPTQAPAHAPVYSPNYTPGLAFYQPEFLFAGHYDDLHVSNDPADYDYVQDNVWYKYIPLDMTPVTYIYLPQIVLHHNRGRIAQIDGTGNLTGMARSVNLKSHITSNEDIAVNHTLRMKRDVDYVPPTQPTLPPEKVDVIGGRAMTFGLTGCDPFHITRSSSSFVQIAESKVRNYLEVKMIFNNGIDSTMVFDVTDQVKERYKGGVITIHLDCDTIRIPSRSGGSGFDAVVKDFEEETYEFDM